MDWVLDEPKGLLFILLGVIMTLWLCKNVCVCVCVCMCVQRNI